MLPEGCEAAVRAVRLGLDGPVVSRFCLGLLSLSRLQSNLPRAEAAGLLEEALAAGVTFFDTAEIYSTYPLVREVLKPPAVVATKAYACDYGEMRASIRRALSETGRERIDIFLLHEQESRLTLRGHSEAWRCLVEARRAGVLGAVGVSTHAPEVVAAAAEMEDLQVIHPLVNYRGLGLLGGTLAEMLSAIERAGEAGKGIYAMKILGGGHLAGPGRGQAPEPGPDPRWELGPRQAAAAVGRADQAFAFVRGLPHVQAVAVGVKSREELLVDLALLAGRQPPAEQARLVGGRPRALLIEEHCEGCGACLKACRYGALRLTAAGGPTDRPRAEVDMRLCVLCGYCAAACRDFFIKVV